MCECVCVCADEKVWTVVTHNSSGPVRVQGSSIQKPYIMSFNYSASSDQLRTLVAGSEQCQQEVTYVCRKSRLFNTWGESCESFNTWGTIKFFVVVVLQHKITQEFCCAYLSHFTKQTSKAVTVLHDRMFSHILSVCSLMILFY